MKNIKIKNFQSHKNTELHLHPNVNVIVGQSSSGKTAIFRAIEWLNTNRPLGTRFISHGEKECEVVIDNVKGVKTSSGKTYHYLADSKYSSGSNVPDLVLSELALSDLNVQNQLDEHFLITSSPGEVARTFNRILNIEKVDEYVSKLTSSINTTKTKLETKTERKESLFSRLESLSYLDKMTIEVEEIQRLIELKEKSHVQHLILSQYIPIAEKLTHEIVFQRIQRKKLIRDLKALNELIEKSKRHQKLYDLYIQFKNLNYDIIYDYQLSENILYDLKSIDLEKPSKLRETIFKLAKGREDYDHYDYKVKEKKIEKHRIHQNILDLISLYTEELAKLKICPICKSQITDTSHVVTKLRKRYEIDIP